nr:hypothetical protein B0A51_15321 [Rachicladosporium sp. CCFEE 5018]
MTVDPYLNCNRTIDSTLCTLDTCCLAQSHFNYIPSFGGNAFFAAFFGIILILQLGFGLHYKTRGFLIGMVVGLALEIVGYACRVLIHNQPFQDNPFLIYLITLTIAPVFLTAAIYLSLTRIIALYGTTLSRFRPATIACSFIASDFLSLVLQAAGGAIADTSNTAAGNRMGANIMVAGLVLQAISLTAFIAVAGDFAWACHRRSHELNTNDTYLRTRRRGLFKAFLVALLLATTAILIRSIFRAAELWGGFKGSLWNDEIAFMVLDGAMIAIAAICLTVFHPGPAFRGLWKETSWTFRRNPPLASKPAHRRWSLGKTIWTPGKDKDTSETATVTLVDVSGA